MSIFDATEYDHLLRRMNSIVHTLWVVAESFDELPDEEDPDRRADLLVLAENLIDVATYVTEQSRDLAWQYTPVPEHED